MSVERSVEVFVIFVVLFVGLECGYRIGVHAEAANHRKYIESLNVGAMSADSDENCADGPCEATDR